MPIVDEEIEHLISALSLFPKLQTIESCQGGRDDPVWVCFTYGDYWNHAWNELASFVLGFLGPGLSNEIGDDAAVKITLTGENMALGHLTVRPSATKRTIKALKRLHYVFAG